MGDAVILARVEDTRTGQWYAVAIVAGHRRWVACDPPGGAL